MGFIRSHPMGVPWQAPGKLLSPARVNLTLMATALFCLRSQQECHHHCHPGALGDLTDMPLDAVKIDNKTSNPSAPEGLGWG